MGPGVLGGLGGVLAGMKAARSAIKSAFLINKLVGEMANNA